MLTALQLSFFLLLFQVKLLLSAVQFVTHSSLLVWFFPSGLLGTVSNPIHSLGKLLLSGI